jgi:hypothetical protein
MQITLIPMKVQDDKEEEIIKRVAMYISFLLCTGSEVKIIPLLLSPEYQKSGMCGQDGIF